MPRPGKDPQLPLDPETANGERPSFGRGRLGPKTAAILEARQSAASSSVEVVLAGNAKGYHEAYEGWLAEQPPSQVYLGPDWYGAGGDLCKN